MRSVILPGAIVIAGSFFLAAGTGTPPSQGVKSIGNAPTAVDIAKMPVNFIPNRGQIDPKVSYYVQGTDKTVCFGPDGVTFILASGNPGANNPGADAKLNPDAEPNSRWVVKLDFIGADPETRPVGSGETGAVFSYFHGRPENWKAGLPAYSRILYPNLWPGIDLAYSGTGDKLKYEFIVHPGADPSRVRLAYRGADSIRVDDRGSLVVETPAGGFEDGTPIAYQTKGAERTDVPLAFKIEKAPGPDVSGNGLAFGFSVGSYDPTLPLVLDPVILIDCGYVGGPGHDYIYGLAADASGSSYVVGYTYSLAGSFPTAVGPDSTFNGGNVDAFVAKLDASGAALAYCGYLGGAGQDFGYGIAVDTAGRAYVTGYTTSPEATFPVAVGPDLTHNGQSDAFVARVNASGTALEYCGYLGGSGNDYGRGIAVDGFGYAFVTGSTYSSEATFPESVGPDLTFAGGQEAFVASVKADGTALAYCGYIGGRADDSGSAIAVDATGNAYVTGSTSSSEATFPVWIGPSLVFEGESDAFAAKVEAGGTAFGYLGYIAGTSKDYGQGIAVDPEGNAYVTGYTSSTENTFPITGGPDVSQNGQFDAFVARVHASGGFLDFCGFIGGVGFDAGAAIAVDRWGYTYITGYTSSDEDSFPVKVGPGLVHGGSFDAFVAKVDAAGADFAFCGYIGGLDSDVGTAVALGPPDSSDVFIAGNTYSTELTFPVAGRPTLVHSGGRDGFMAKVHENLIFLTAPNGGESWHVGFPFNITWLSTGEIPAVKIEFSIDDGETWEEIVASTENDGLFTWTIPDAVSEECRVRISDAADADPSDTSLRLFAIQNDPVLILTSPNGGEIWRVGTPHEITWISGGDVADVAIEFTSDRGATWTYVVTSTENDGVFEWIVPDAVSEECLVRISEAADADPLDPSDGLFSIVASASSLAKKPGKVQGIKKGGLK